MANWRENSNVNPDLAKERSSATFHPEELTYLIDGDEASTEQRRRLDAFVLDDPDLRCQPGDAYLSYEDAYSRALQKSLRLVKKIRESPVWETDIEATIGVFVRYYGTTTFPEGVPIGVHFGMFIPGIIGHGNDEQQSEWLGRAMELNIIGCYAQTEMGHGTFIRGLETTATYDPSTEEFVLHSPTITSTKWWPGCLGRTCNHALVVAQLYSNGKNYGPHFFIVPIRSMEDHKPLPGVTVGEIGPKLAGNCVDNGYLRFHHVRIPRMNMMMKHSQVQPDGSYVRPQNNKLNYGTMVLVRVMLLRGAACHLASASTIAIRYSAVRRQSELIEGQPEAQILDYQAQQYKLFPCVAATYAIYFASLKMWEIYRSIYSKMQEGELDGMPELHALSSGLKAITTDIATSGVEVCRLACGGHGYMTSAGFARLYGLSTAAVTYEGENTVLLLQTARYLMKAYREAQRGRPVQSSVSYLACSAGGKPTTGHSLHDLVGLYQQAASSLVALAAERLQRNTEKRNSAALAWNDTAFHLIKCAKFHSQCFMVWTFYDRLKTLDMSDALRHVLSDVYELYALHWIRENSGDFLRCQSVTPNDLEEMETRIQELLSSLRPNIVTLVDAFDLRDEQLNSVLGCYDGRAYERLYEEATLAPTNTKPVRDQDVQVLQELMQSKL